MEICSETLRRSHRLSNQSLGQYRFRGVWTHLRNSEHQELATSVILYKCLYICSSRHHRGIRRQPRDQQIQPISPVILIAVAISSQCSYGFLGISIYPRPPRRQLFGSCLSSKPLSVTESRQLIVTQSSTVLVISLAKDVLQGRQTSGSSRAWTTIGILLILVCLRATNTVLSAEYQQNSLQWGPLLFAGAYSTSSRVATAIGAIAFVVSLPHIFILIKLIAIGCVLQPHLWHLQHLLPSPCQVSWTKISSSLTNLPHILPRSG